METLFKASCPISRRLTILLTFMALTAPAGAQEGLTNDSVVKLIKSGSAENIVVNMGSTRPGKYALDADHVQELKKAGVTDAVIAAMQSEVNGT
jgi:hypothetical protein